MVIDEEEISGVWMARHIDMEKVLHSAAALENEVYDGPSRRAITARK